MKILLIEDNINIGKSLKESLEKNGYELIVKPSLSLARKYLESTKPNLIILDISLPDGNGFDFFKNVIKKINIPTIILTAFDSEEDIVNGLNMGADDYLTKPFSIKELVARINKILKINKNIVKVKDITYDFDKMMVYKNNIPLSLTPLELQLLNLLFLNLNHVVSRSMILDTIWNLTGNDVDDHTVTVYFNRLKKKLDSDIIKTLKGIGYRIDEE